MKMISTLLLLGSFSATAATPGYDLTIDYAQNGQRVTSPRVQVKEGETATVIRKINGKESFIQVEAQESSMEDKQVIKMKLAVGTIDENGNRTILARPEILTDEKNPASVTIEDEMGDEVSLSVVAKRKTL